MTRPGVYGYVTVALVALTLPAAWIYHQSSAPGDAAAPSTSVARPPAEIVRQSAATQPSGATTQSSPGATTQPVAGPPLPEEYAILQTRNAFARGPAKNGPGAPGGPETMLVLKGVVEAGARFTAFIEDKAAKRVTQVTAGAAIARGLVKTIDLDAIEYVVGGKSRRIEVGQNLNGEIVPPTPTSKPAAPQGPPGAGQPPPGQPPGGPPGKRGGPPPQPQPAQAVETGQ